MTKVADQRHRLESRSALRPEVITRLNKSFVCTTVVIDDVKKRAESGDELQAVDGPLSYPLQMMFLKTDGALISKLNSFQTSRASTPTWLPRRQAARGGGE